MSIDPLPGDVRANNVFPNDMKDLVMHILMHAMRGWRDTGPNVLGHLRPAGAWLACRQRDTLGRTGLWSRTSPTVSAFSPRLRLFIAVGNREMLRPCPRGRSSRRLRLPHECHATPPGPFEPHLSHPSRALSQTPGALKSSFMKITCMHCEKNLVYFYMVRAYHFMGCSHDLANTLKGEVLN